jgi:glycosyltransferase involved in cell wall biosynthesis
MSTSAVAMSSPRRMRATNRLRVLQMVTKADLGGAQMHVLDLLAGFRDDFEMVLAAGEEGFCTETARSLGIECRILPSLVHRIDLSSDLKAVIETRGLFGEVRPDLVHCHTTKAGLVGRFAARIANVPAIYTAHTWCFSEGTSLSWRLLGRPCETAAALCSRCIITVSDANREAALKHKIASPRKLITVHNGVADTSHRANPGEPGALRIAMVARFAAQKNQALLVKAVSKLNTPVKLTFIGDGPLRAEVEKAASHCPPYVRVEFLGQRTDIPQILSQANLFVLSTNWEGFPISILEAMRAGLPVIATDVNGVREAVENGVTGLLVRPGDGDQLLNALKEMAMDPERRAQMGARARAVFESRFSLSAMLRKTASVYEMALGSSIEVFEGAHASSFADTSQ